MNTAHSWTPLPWPTREWASRLGGQDNFGEDTTASPNPEVWPGCQQRAMASHGGIPGGICNTCKGEKMLSKRTVVKFGWTLSLCLWIQAGGGAWKSSLQRALPGSVSSSYLRSEHGSYSDPDLCMVAHQSPHLALPAHTGPLQWHCIPLGVPTWTKTTFKSIKFPFLWWTFIVCQLV